METRQKEQQYRTNERHAVRKPPADLEPHPLANEIVDEHDLEKGARDEQHHVTPSLERRSTNWLGGVLLLLLAAGIVLATIAFFPNPWMIAASIAFVVAIGYFFLWPVLMAHETKVVQDERVRDVKTPRR